MKHHTGSSFGSVVEWLAILIIAVYAVPLVINLLFAGVSSVGATTVDLSLNTDPFAAADYELAQSILEMGGRKYA